jgi:hypothetical protein
LPSLTTTDSVIGLEFPEAHDASDDISIGFGATAADGVPVNKTFPVIVPSFPEGLYGVAAGVSSSATSASSSESSFFFPQATDNVSNANNAINTSQNLLRLLNINFLREIPMFEHYSHSNNGTGKSRKSPAIQSKIPETS